MVTRRLLLVTAGSLLVHGCAAPPTPPPPTPPPVPGPIPANVIDDVQAILTGLEAMLPGLGIFLPADVAARVTGEIATLATLVQQIVDANQSGGGVPALVNAFVSGVEAVLTQFGVNLPSWAGVAVTAIRVLLPIILEYLGVASSRRAAIDPAREAQARAVLRSVRAPVVRPR